MKKETLKTWLIILPLVIFLASMQGKAYACKKCDQKSGFKKKGLSSKLMFKAGIMLAKKDLLGLSEEQVNQIKELKVSAKKDIIKGSDEIDILKVDIRNLLHQPTINLPEVKKLIEKQVVRADIQLKSVPYYGMLMDSIGYINLNQ